MLGCATSESPARRETTGRNPSPPAGFSCASAGCPAPPVGLGSDDRPGHGTAPRGATRPPLPRPRGSGNRRDRSPARTRRGHRQGVSLRSNRREGTGGQGALPGGVSRLRGAHGAPQNGKGDAYAYCKRCHPGAIAPEWTRERVREAMRAWRARYGAAPSSYDWSRTHARRRRGEPLKRLQAAEWPAPSTVIDLYGSWAAARADARLRRRLNAWTSMPLIHGRALVLGPCEQRLRSPRTRAKRPRRRLR